MVDPQALPEDAPTIAGGRYVLANRIGEGGMAGVYKAWDNRLRVWRAVKVLFPKYARKRKLRQRFLSEAHTMARLEHPNLVRIYDVGDASTLPYIVMELVNGGTLIHWTLLNGPMPPRMAVDAILQLCRGVAFVHRGGIVHRDIKPHNVLITPDGVCKLTDFGIAQGAGDGLTKTGSTMGTLGYMAPEQRNDAKSVDARADIFSIGATLWHLLNAEQVVDLFMAEEEPSLLKRVPEPLRPVLVRAVAYKRDDRYPDARSLHDALRSVREQLPDDPPDVPSLPLDESAISDHGPETDYPEIRLVLDGVHSDLSEDSATGEAPLRPPASQAQPKVLPYYMPSSGGDDTHDKSLTQRRAQPEEDLPDWVDRSSYDNNEEEFVIGVDPSLVRSEEEVQADLERRKEEEAWPDRAGEDDDLGAAPPPDEKIGPPGAPEAAPPPSAHSDGPSRFERYEEEESEEPDWIAEEDRLPRQPKRAPVQVVAPEPEEEGGLKGLLAASAVTVPLAGALVVGIVVVVLGMGVLGFGAYGNYGAASAATESRSQLYSILRTDGKQVIASVADPGAERTELEAAYIDWYEAAGEPERSEAAMAFLDRLTTVADRRLAQAEGTQTLQEAQHTMRRIRAARTQYDRDMAAWVDNTSGGLGSLVVTLGIGTAPPR